MKTLLILLTLLLTLSINAQNIYTTKSYSVEIDNKEVQFKADIQLLINETALVVNWNGEISGYYIYGTKHLIDDEAMIYYTDTALTQAIIVFYNKNTYYIKIDNLLFRFYN
jgi:hypothetical protein